MVRMLACGFAALSAAAGFAQPAAKPSFDAADVRVSPRSEWVRSPTHPLQGGFQTNERYELRRASMLDLIRLAYNVDPERILGGPSWLDYDRFDITGKTRPGASAETLRLMLQSLLEERFGLMVKSETREVPGFVLSRGKRELKLAAPAENTPPGNCTMRIAMMPDGPAPAHVACRASNMQSLADLMRRQISGPNRNVPLLESTGIEGRWDFEFDFVRSPDRPVEASLAEPLEKLGLKLEAGLIPQPVLSVVRVNQQPAPNAADIAQTLPALPPPQFEVASIKYPCNDDHSRALQFEAGGRATATCMPLMTLIRQSFGLANWQEPAGAPKWLDSGHNISIFAKAPAGMAVDPKNNPMARDLLHSMLRSLLIERYQMKFHYEDRPTDAFTLVANKPKLTKADPAGRTGCKREGQQQNGRALMVSLVCRNMTMAQLAEQIPAYDPDVFFPVLDGTNLEGAYDFTVHYDAFASLNAHFPGGLGGGGGDAAAGDASTPSGGLGFREAIEKQFGLKMEIHKRPVPVLVIDKMEEKVIEN